MGNKQKRKKKFGIAGGKHSLKRMRPWARYQWLQKKASEGHYWYCCAICHEKFINTTDLISHQNSCRNGTIAATSQGQCGSTPLARGDIAKDLRVADGVKCKTDLDEQGVRVPTENYDAPLTQIETESELLDSAYERKADIREVLEYQEEASTNRQYPESSKTSAIPEQVYVIAQDGCAYTYYFLSRNSKPNNMCKKDDSTTDYWETVNYRERLNSYIDKTGEKRKASVRKSVKELKASFNKSKVKIKTTLRTSTKDKDASNIDKDTSVKYKHALTKQMRVRIQISLDDHPDCYCTEDFTIMAPSVRNKPNEDRQSTRYLCKLCGSYRTLDRKQLEKHIACHLSGKLNCKLCNFIADSFLNLRNHTKAKHNETMETRSMYLCDICGLGMSHLATFNRHVSKVHGTACYKCNQCNSQFQSDVIFREHRLNAHKDSSVFKCEKCNEIYLSQISYNAHCKKGQCDQSLFKCRYCNIAKDSYRRIRYHERMVHVKGSVHKCMICSFSAISKAQWTNHMNSHLRIIHIAARFVNFRVSRKTS